MKTFSKFAAVQRVFHDLKIQTFYRHSIPIVYFTDRKNVGDLLNEFLVPRISGKKIIRVRSAALPHLRAVGSVLGSSSRNSYVWGSGSIDGKAPTKQLDATKIFALRGKNTYNLLKKSLGVRMPELPLGDPAILMPKFYAPKLLERWKIGIVPHFSDRDCLKRMFDKAPIEGATIISVEQEPEEFITEICQCKFIVSSSLHGLVLADSYDIPNKWISVSDKLLGGSFKFKDYYTTTDFPTEEVYRIEHASDLAQLANDIEIVCKVNKFIECSNELLGSFPHSFTSRF